MIFDDPVQTPEGMAALDQALKEHPPESWGALPIDPEVARVEGQARLEALRGIRAAIQRVEAERQAQVEEILHWAGEEIHTLETEAATLEHDLRPYVRVLVDTDPLGRKSASFPAGTAGFKDDPASCVFDDTEGGEDAALEWFRSAKRAEFIGVVESVKRAEVKKHLTVKNGRYTVPVLGEDGSVVATEIVPGLRCVQAKDVFFVRPSKPRAKANG